MNSAESFESFEIINEIDIPDQMDIIPREEHVEIKECNFDDKGRVEVTKFDSVYYYLLICSGLWQPSHWKKKKIILYTTYRVFIMIMMNAFILVEFGFYGQTWLLLETDYPFTMAQYILREVRWVSAYAIILIYCSTGNLGEFINNVNITVFEWQSYRFKRVVYIVLMFCLIVLCPCGILYFDLIWLETHNIVNSIKIPTLIILFWKFFYKILIFPAFAVVSVILFLTGNHILLTGKTICSYTQSTCNFRIKLLKKIKRFGIKNRKNNSVIFYVKEKISGHDGMYEVEKLLTKLKSFIKHTGASLSLFLAMQLFLLMAGAFTTVMSTIERLEIVNKYNHNDSMRLITVGFNKHTIPLTKLIQSKTALLNMKKALNVTYKQTPNVTQMHDFYRSMSVLQEHQIHLMELLIESGHNNVTVGTNGAKQPSLYTLVMSITDKYGSMRVILENALIIVETFSLYMIPILLISRANFALSMIHDDVLDADIKQQRFNNFVFDTKDKKLEIAQYIKTIQGIKIYGSHVQFYKTLILVTFAPFFAITLRGLWKHYGFW